MTHEHVKGATDKAKGAIEDSSKKQPEPEFDKPLGSSHNDELDLRDVARQQPKSHNNCDAVSKLCRPFRAAFRLLAGGATNG